MGEIDYSFIEKENFSLLKDDGSISLFDDDNSDKHTKEPDGLEEEFRLSEVFSDSGFDDSITKQKFTNYGFVSSESWDKIISIPSRVLDINENHVTCECLIDRDSGIYETRIFSRSLFSLFKKISIGFPVLIKIYSKANSNRIDVFDGTNIVKNEDFELNSTLKELEDYPHNTPFNPPS